MSISKLHLCYYIVNGWPYTHAEHSSKSVHV